MEKYLSAKQLAELLGVAKTSIWRWAASGKLPKGERITPKCTRWKESDVMKAVEALKEATATQTSVRS